MLFVVSGDLYMWQHVFSTYKHHCNDICMPMSFNMVTWSIIIMYWFANLIYYKLFYISLFCLVSNTILYNSVYYVCVAHYIFNILLLASSPLIFAKTMWGSNLIIIVLRRNQLRMFKTPGQEHPIKKLVTRIPAHKIALAKISKWNSLHLHSVSL